MSYSDELDACSESIKRMPRRCVALFLTLLVWPIRHANCPPADGPLLFSNRFIRVRITCHLYRRQRYAGVNIPEGWCLRRAYLAVIFNPPGR